MTVDQLDCEDVCVQKPSQQEENIHSSQGQREYSPQINNILSQQVKRHKNLNHFKDFFFCNDKNQKSAQRSLEKDHKNVKIKQHTNGLGHTGSKMKHIKGF